MHHPSGLDLKDERLDQSLETAKKEAQMNSYYNLSLDVQRSRAAWRREADEKSVEYLASQYSGPRRRR